MVERSRGSRLLLEAAQALGIVRRAGWQNLDRHFASQAGIARAVDLSHTSRAEGGDDFVRAKL